MASGFVVPDRDQSFLVATSYRELLGDDDLVWTVIEVVEGLDLSGIYARYRPDDGRGGRPAFDPAMMLALLVFGYCEGKRSVRELETACRRDVAYQAICGGMTPDHATIGRFRVAVDDVLDDLFVQVLAACAVRGLVDVGRVALDGTKLEAAASKQANRTADTLAGIKAQVAAILAETTEALRPDPADPADGPHGDAGDSGDGGDGGGGWSLLRRERDLQRRLSRVEAAEVEAERARQAREHDKKRRGRERPGEPSANLTDPDSRLQWTAQHRFVQGYNSQAVVSADQIVVAVTVTADATDVGMLEPMTEVMFANLATAGISQRPGVILADAGYWSEANSHLEQTLDGTYLLISPGDKHHRVGQPPEPLADNATPAAQARHSMQTRLARPLTADLYRQRSWMIEGCFAHTKTHRGITRFSRRGLDACQAEWTLIHLAGNILKIHQARHRHPGHGPNPPHQAHHRHQHPTTHSHHPRPHHPHRPHHT
jgi:transposase